jgi:muconolactone delta-isomerase
MPRFLVEISVALPPDMPSIEHATLLERERERGRELKQAGVIQDIWRVPGRLANVGIWRTPSVTALHEAIASLPVWAWTEVTVTPLADHHLTSEPEGTDGGGGDG